MKAVEGYKIKLPADSEIEQKFHKFSEGWNCLMVTEPLGDKYALMGRLIEWDHQYPGMGGTTSWWDGHVEAPDFLVSLCEEAGLTWGIFGVYVVVDEKTPSRFSRFTLAFSENYRKLRPGTTPQQPEFGALISPDLSFEETRICPPTPMQAIFGNKNLMEFKVVYTRRFKCPPPGIIINLIEDIIIPPSARFISMFIHPIGLVNFSHLQAERNNRGSCWGYLPADLIAHYVFPMVSQN